MTVDILDAGSGNMKSIQNWLERLYIPTTIVKNPTELKSNFLVLPGVGSIGPYMEKLKKKSFDKAIHDHINNGGRLLGICLGLHIMGAYSEEDGGVEGLGLITGYTARLKNDLSHNGWENFLINKDKLETQSLYSSMKLTKRKNVKGRVFYNHEYGFVCQDEKIFNKPISTSLNRYSSLVIKDTIIGIQFHPEKSQQTGIDLMSIIL
jgi:imidazole glycerol-phosphate synthase subunit HisH